MTRPHLTNLERGGESKKCIVTHLTKISTLISSHHGQSNADESGGWALYGCHRRGATRGHNGGGALLCAALLVVSAASGYTLDT